MPGERPKNAIEGAKVDPDQALLLFPGCLKLRIQTSQATNELLLERSIDCARAVDCTCRKVHGTCGAAAASAHGGPGDVSRAFEAFCAV
eukprot:3900996-Rhodomonas_salina.5